MLEKHVIANISSQSSPDFDDKTNVGKPLQGKASFRCKSDGHKIISTEGKKIMPHVSLVRLLLMTMFHFH